MGGLFLPCRELVAEGRTVDVRVGDRLSGSLDGMGHMTELLVRAFSHSGARISVEWGPAQMGPSCGIHAAEWAARTNEVGFPALMSVSTANHADDEAWFRACNLAVRRKPINQTHWCVHWHLRARGAPPTTPNPRTCPTRTQACTCASTRRPSACTRARPPARAARTSATLTQTS